MKSLLMGKFVKCAKAEPLRWNNNIVIEWFKHLCIIEWFKRLCKICVSQFTLKQFNSFKQNPNENSAKPGKDFTFSFRGKKFFNITDKNVFEFQNTCS